MDECVFVVRGNETASLFIFFSMFLSGFFLFHSKIKATNITNREICTEHKKRVYRIAY